MSVSQTGSSATATLRTALTGATTTVVVTPTSGTFDTTNAITINGHATTPIPTGVDGSATTKWGNIGDWDVSVVKDFSYAFTAHRDKDGGSWNKDVNLKVEAVESHLWKAMSKFDTSSATSLSGLFNGAIQMNIDVSGWDVAKVRVWLNGGRFIDRWCLMLGPNSRHVAMHTAESHAIGNPLSVLPSSPPPALFFCPPTLLPSSLLQFLLFVSLLR